MSGGCAGGMWGSVSWFGVDFRVMVLNSSKLFLASDLGFTGIPESGFRGLGFGVWIWVSGFRGVWGLVLHRRLRWFARGLLARRRTTPKGDSPGGGYSPGGGHSTTDVQSKAVDQNQEEKFSPPGAGALCLKAKSSFSGRGHPFLPGRRRVPNRMSFMAID